MGEQFKYEPAKVLEGLQWKGGLPPRLTRKGEFVSFGPAIFGRVNLIERLLWKLFGKVPSRFSKFEEPSFLARFARPQEPE